MGCNKDEGCLNIANNVYPGLQGEINGSISSITNNVNEIISGLSGLSIPDDYLGEKVKSQVDSICGSLTSDVGEISSLSGSINNFVGSKIEEHQEHYRNWLAQQEWQKKNALKAKQKETTIETEEIEKNQ